MGAFRLLDQLPQYRKADGTLCAGGSIVFSNTGTSTARPVYGEAALSTNLGSTITLDADARHSEDVWLSGEYRVRLLDSAGVQIWLRENVRDVASAGLQPPDPADGANGEVLHTDGAAWYFDTVLAIPSQSGNNGKVLTTDGSALSWATPDEAPTYSSTNLPGGVTQDADSFQIGKLLVQFGSGTADSAAAQTTSEAVMFATAYTGSLLHVSIMPTVGAVTGESGGVEVACTSSSVSGFTATLIAPDMGAVVGSENIGSNVTFTYVAFGLMA